MNLAQLQRNFSGFLRGDGTAAFAAVAPSAKRGLPVYHYAYRATLVATLRDVFERTHGWLGDDRFDTAARTHIAEHPPHSWTLADYGLGFNETLASLYPDNPEVAELAWLDWSLRAAFNGPDSAELDVTALATQDWDAATLELAPTLVWREIRTNVATLWHALETACDDPPAAELLDGPAVLTVWRHGLMPRFQTVTANEHRAMLLAEAGMAFGLICEMLAASHDDPDAAAAVAGSMLGRWIAEGVLVGVA
ncbi:HvfC/BufC N-terminal domain-containing protein [Sphingomonas sp. 35-24ZXX]|uniref:HvfC/BufC N-terminal domain-containing protein n=1 Tax=Sphingomonas sp. 35-24ZXX TaxID=1545915 RepID=UPI00053BE1EB|nr:DNA-binding domain-containing protein [Sphingomonas sp. 35-24ZXX]